MESEWKVSGKWVKSEYDSLDQINIFKKCSQMFFIDLDFDNSVCA